MKSTLLEKHGLINYIAGSEFDFRYKNVGENMEKEVDRALSIMDITPKEIYSGKQVHGQQVAYCEENSGHSFVFGRQFEETDGLLTDKDEIALVIKFADCTPIILFDPVNRVHASVHSGWRGTVQRISTQAIHKMVKEFGSKTKDILVFLGPSIDMNHYEIGSEVYEAFSDFKERDSFFKEHQGKYLMSMTDANISLLKEAGIKEKNMDVSRISTFTDPILHSARQEGKDYKLNGMITMLRAD